MNLEEVKGQSNQGGCCGRNKFTICLAIVVVILIGIIFALTFVVLSFVVFSDMLAECASSACIKSSAEILEFVDDSVDPCEDFYGFVCGKFEKVAYEKQINNLLNAERERMKNHFDSFIVEPLAPDDSQPVKLQKKYFRSCLNVKAVDEDKDQTLRKKLLEIADWPLLQGPNKWNEKNFEWTSVMIKARELGLPFEWFLKVDLYRDNNYELQLSLPENCGNKLTDEYFAMQREVLENFTDRGIDLLLDFDGLKNFEKRLNWICANITGAETSLNRITSLKLLNVEESFFLRSLTELSHKWLLTHMLVFDTRYIAELNKFLNETSEKDQANYILWKIVEHFAPYLTESIREKYLQQTSQNDVSRFQFCLDDTKSKFNFVSEFIQLQKYAESSVRENGENMVNSIHEEIISFIEDTEWRDNRTKQSHLDFYGSLELIIGANDDMYENDFLKDYLHIDRFVFHSSNIIQMITDWDQNSFLVKMRRVGERASSFNSIQEANSEFVVVLDEQTKQLIIPLSAFKSFLYDSDRPEYLNYAGLGTIIREELITGLKLLIKDKSETYVDFEASKRCLIENLRKSKKNINASLLFYKNYEALLAQALAYRAYQAHAEDSEELPLINLPYTPNQLFWIKSSLNWCYHPLPEEDDLLDMQQILKYRILEAVKNSDSFALDFNCSSNAQMNPKNKCQL